MGLTKVLFLLSISSWTQSAWALPPATCDRLLRDLTPHVETISDRVGNVLAKNGLSVVRWRRGLPVVDESSGLRGSSGVIAHDLDTAAQPESGLILRYTNVEGVDGGMLIYAEDVSDHHVEFVAIPPGWEESRFSVDRARRFLRGEIRVGGDN